METKFNAFSTCNKTIWQEQIEKELKGITYDALSKIDRNNITRFPFYSIEDNQNKLINPNVQLDWEICVNINVKNAIIANTEALFFLNKGASGLIFEFGEMEKIDFNVLLKDIEIKHILLHFKLKIECQSLFSSFEGYLNNQGISFADLNCIVTFDPINLYTQTNDFSHAELENQMFEGLKIQKVTSNLSIDGAIYQNTGTNSILELACILGHLNEYLYFYSERYSLNDIQKVHVTIAIGTDFFEQIAKTRALRILLEFLLEKYGLQSKILIHAETSMVNISTIDVNNNLLRTSIMGMAAVLGGCDSLLVHPHKEDCRSTKRIVVNQQIIFKEEGHFNKIEDAAAGSYFIEDLTRKLSERAWGKFQEMENNDGFLSSLTMGLVQNEAAIHRANLIQEYINGNKSLIGVNKFINETDSLNGKGNEIFKRNAKTLYPISISAELLK